MADEITHDFRIDVPDRQWRVASQALRALRQIHRAAGGTSRMVKHGTRVTLTLTGPAAAVLDGARNVTRLAEAMLHKEREREQTIAEFIMQMQQQWDQQEREAASLLLDALNNTRKKT